MRTVFVNSVRRWVINRYDNSQVAQFQKCPMSYYLQYVRGLSKNILCDDNIQMEFGSAVHKFLENHFLYKPNNIDELVDGFEEVDGIPQYSKAALKLFCNTYLERFNESDRAYRTLDAEECSEFKVGDYDFVVKRDGAVSRGGNIYGLEHKTTKSISYNFFDKFFLNSQITAQVYDVKRKFNACGGILINAGEIKFLKRKPTANYDGIVRYEDGWLAVKFSRDIVNRTKEEIEDWLENTELWINEIERCKASNTWLKSTASWGGIICSSCTYKEICKTSHGTDLDDSVVDCLYSEVDPYEYLKTQNTKEETVE